VKDLFEEMAASIKGMSKKQAQEELEKAQIRVSVLKSWIDHLQYQEEMNNFENDLWAL